MDETQKIALTEQYEAESTTEVPNTLSSSNNSSKISVSQTQKKILQKISDQKSFTPKKFEEETFNLINSIFEKITQLNCNAKIMNRGNDSSYWIDMKTYF